jgi:hypothetical protein
MSVKPMEMPAVNGENGGNEPRQWDLWLKAGTVSW